MRSCNHLNILKAIANGTQTLLDWHDEGFAPIEQSAAQDRADICTGRLDGSPCPSNQNRTFSIAATVAGVVHRQIEVKNGMKLSVMGEENLHICMVCRCLLPLKVWTPMDLIMAHTDAVMLNEFNKFPKCWINKTKNTP